MVTAFGLLRTPLTENCKCRLISKNEFDPQNQRCAGKCILLIFEKLFPLPTRRTFVMFGKNPLALAFMVLTRSSYDLRGWMIKPWCNCKGQVRLAVCQHDGFWKHVKMRKWIADHFVNIEC